MEINLIGAIKMIKASLEHANVTVSNPDLSAELLCKLFGWEVRWSGMAKNKGYTVHVGDQDSYLALYTHKSVHDRRKSNFRNIKNLNHLGVVVSDLDSVEEKVKSAGLEPFNHGDYEPGRRFYFYMQDDLEIEVVSYQ